MSGFSGRRRSVGPCVTCPYRRDRPGTAAAPSLRPNDRRIDLVDAVILGAEKDADQANRDADDGAGDLSECPADSHTVNGSDN